MLQAVASQLAPCVVRPMVPADAAFVFATWLNNLKSSSAYGKALQRDAFFKSFHRTIEALLKRPRCRVLVAHPEGEAGIIVGYLVTDAVRDVPVVHFGFTKGPFRRMGIMHALMEASGLNLNECIWSCPTEAEGWLKARFPSMEVLDVFR